VRRKRNGGRPQKNETTAGGSGAGAEGDQPTNKQDCELKALAVGNQVFKNHRLNRTARDTETQNTAKFKCDGRIYCSQMTSCEEAKFFLENCPGVKMDGNRDGVPCEK
jgi:hypothetical protein